MNYAVPRIADLHPVVNFSATDMSLKSLDPLGILGSDSADEEVQKERLTQLYKEDPSIRLRLRDYTSSLEGELVKAEEAIAVKTSVRDWLSASEDGFRLQRNDCSRAHKLFESMLASDRPNRAEAVDAMKRAHVFVVRHDWSAALGPAIEGNGGEVLLPYPTCLFEFVINGRCVIVWALQEEGKRPVATPFLEHHGGWFVGGEEDVAEGGLFHFAWLQVVGICVALDAELATHEVVRAPAALNKKRERSGKSAVMDFHIIDLARRHRVHGPGTGSHRSPRLHFRRGHWRHYSDHKSWIRWTLVGNPDLGFVQKHYSI